MNKSSSGTALAVLVSNNAPNNFNIIRVIASFLVLLSHSYPLSGRFRFEPLTVWSGDNFSMGSFAVGIFFIISGFLITKSFDESKTLKQFAVNRLLRIYPALIVLVLLSTLVAGPLLTTLTAKAYFHNEATWLYLENAVGGTVQYFLPGVFEDNPFSTTFNGSLWTIPIELFFYLATLFIGACAYLLVLAKRKLSSAQQLFLQARGKTIVLLSCIALILCDFHVATHDALSNLQLFWLPSLSTTIPCAAYYATGATAYLYRDKLRLEPGVAAVCALLFWGAFQTPIMRGISYITLTYLTLFLAYAATDATARLRDYSKKADYSYGVYLYGFPIQQTLQHFSGGHLNPLRLFLLSVPIVVAFAACSWHLIENPCLKLKRLLY